MRCPTCGSKECCGGDYAKEAEYLRQMAECAAIMAVAGYFSRMRGPDAWTWGFSGFPNFGRHKPNVEHPAINRPTPLYAGSAPVPAAQNVLDQATAYARDIVTWLHRDHYADSTAFEPFDDLLGLLSQIDNMICGWKEHPAAQAEAKVADGWVLVPREPTEEMVIAALKEVDPLRELIEWTDGHGFMREDVRRAWSAMLAAKAKGGS